jgi:HEAT repeat protein
MKRYSTLWAASALAALALFDGCSEHAAVRRGSPAVAAEVQRYVALLKSEDPAEQFRAAWQLGELGPATAPAAAALLDVKGDPGGGEKLEESPDGRLSGLGLEAWASASPSYRQTWSLCLYGWGRSCGPRNAALWALRHIGPAAEHDLVAALADPQEEKRELAAAAISVRAMPGAVPALLAVFSDIAPKVRAAAARSLVGSTDPRVAQLYVRLLGDPDVSMRGTAAIGLGWFHTPEAVDALAVALNDEDVLVVEAAAKSLGAMGGERAQAALLAALNRKDNRLPPANANEKVKREADAEFRRLPVIRALGCFRTSEVARALISAHKLRFSRGAIPACAVPENARSLASSGPLSYNLGYRPGY